MFHYAGPRKLMGDRRVADKKDLADRSASHTELEGNYL